MLSLLNTYLLPVALSVPLLLLLVLLLTRPGEDTPRTSAPGVLVIDDSAVARAKPRKLFEGAAAAMGRAPHSNFNPIRTT
jgi:hypothetical protein